MKKVPELRFPGFKEEWKEQKFNKCFKIIDGDRGKNYPKSEELSDDGFCLFLSAKNVTKDGFMFDEKAFISKEKDLKLGNGKLERKDIVITTRGTIGNISVFSENICYDNIRINSGMIILRSLNSNELFNYQFLKSPNFIKTVKRITFGSAQPQLTKGDISKLRISEPSLDEQEKIADFFSTLDSRIEIQEEKIKNLEYQKKGYMQRIFSQELRFKDENGENYPEWEEKRLGELGEVITGNTPKTNDRSNYGGEYLFVSPADMGNYKHIEYTEKKLSSKGFNKARKIPVGSVLVTCIGSTIGKIGISTTELTTNQQINSIVPNAENNSNFIYYNLEQNFPKYLKNISIQAVPIINKTQFMDLVIFKPTLEEQQKIANFFSLFDEKIEIEKQILEALQEMKKGFLQKMFV